MVVSARYPRSRRSPPASTPLHTLGSRLDPENRQRSAAAKLPSTTRCRFATFVLIQIQLASLTAIKHFMQMQRELSHLRARER